MKKLTKGQVAIGLPLVVTLVASALGAMGWVTNQITAVSNVTAANTSDIRNMDSRFNDQEKRIDEDRVLLYWLVQRQGGNPQTIIRSSTITQGSVVTSQ